MSPEELQVPAKEAEIADVVYQLRHMPQADIVRRLAFERDKLTADLERLRSRMSTQEQQYADAFNSQSSQIESLHAKLSAIADAFESVQHWYDDDGQETDLAKMVGFAVDDLRHDRRNTLTLGKIAAAFGCAPEDCVSQVERLRGVVARLPRTADGVPVVPGMELWNHYYNGYADRFVVQSSYRVYDTTSCPSESHMPFGTFYSTFEAAEQASRPAGELDVAESVRVFEKLSRESAERDTERKANATSDDRTHLIPSSPVRDAVDLNLLRSAGRKLPPDNHAARPAGGEPCGEAAEKGDSHA